MKEKPKVLSIDDSAISQKFVTRALGDDYEIQCALDGQEGLALTLSWLPDVILLDVEMPGINGYEVCDQIRNNEITQFIPVIFLSSLQTLSARMQCYESGGDDFICKPFSVDDLIAKVSVLLRHRQYRDSLQETAEEARRVAHDALTTNSELGLVILFSESSYDSVDYDELAREFLCVTRVLGLNCSLMFQRQAGLSYFTSKGSIAPLEAELMAKLASGNRIRDFGCRTQINYPNISILIKNMPLDDMNRYGRIKDLLPAMLGAANAKVSLLNAEEVMRQRSSDLSNSFERVKDTFLNVAGLLEENREEGHNIMRTMLIDLTNELPRMGLEDDQERYILDQIESAVDQAATVVDNGDVIGQSFDSVLLDLGDLVKAQSSLMDLKLRPNNERDASSNQSLGDMSNGDVELF